MINAFYDRVEQDDLLSPLFPGGVHEEHRRNVSTWWCEVFGGPAAYTEDHGGYEHMLAKHLHLGISAEQRFRFASLMTLAADDADLPSDPEFRSALVAYLEWGDADRARESLSRTRKSPNTLRCHGGVGARALPVRPGVIAAGLGG